MDEDDHPKEDYQEEGQNDIGSSVFDFKDIDID
jgi:hypothetical protein